MSLDAPHRVGGCTASLEWLRPVIPPPMPVLVLADRGLWSPRLWKRIRDLGWHPVLRIPDTTTCTPAGRDRVRRRNLVQPGQAWVGRGRVGTPQKRQLAVTVIVVWTAAQPNPWVVVTDVRPARVGVSWYALRMWIELGFRALNGVGWTWEHTRRTNPERIARDWLILAVATGTRVADAAQLGVPPARLQPRPSQEWHRRARLVRVLGLGLRRLQQQLGRGRRWTRLWLRPEPWPDPPANSQVYIAAEP